MQKNGFLSPIQMTMKFEELVENFERSAEQGQAIHQIMSELGVPSISLPPTEPVSVSSIILACVFVIYAIRRIAGINRGVSGARGN